MSEYQSLRAGSLTMHFDPRLGQVRWIRYGEREVLRGIYGAVRDRDWATIVLRVEQLSIDHSKEAFHVEFLAVCRRGEIDYRWRGVIAGTAESVIRFQFHGEAHSSFERNRIGLCVLHPLRECVGQPCQVEHPDGAVEDTEFPRYISGHQPFFRVAALRHRVDNGIDAEVRFRGDIFETEDQRNWTDASFKTYSTPLELPRPVLIHRGDTVEQEVTVRLSGNVGRPNPRIPRSNVLEVGKVLKLPRLGFQHLGSRVPLEDADLGRLQPIRPAHVRVELSAGDSAYLQDLATAAHDAHRLGASLQVVLILQDDPEAELDRFVAGSSQLTVPVVEWIVLHRSEAATSDQWMKLARARLQSLPASLRIGGGTNGNFAELNRNRPSIDVADVLTYAVIPQAHAFDDETLVENLAGQAETVRSARQFAGRAAIHVGPITLRRRGDMPPPRGALTTPPDDADPRQVSNLLAGWTLGSIAALAREGAAAATYFELTGCRGVIGDQSQSMLPPPFGPLATAVYPVYHVFADVAEFQDSPWREINLATPDMLAGLLVERSAGPQALLANLTDAPLRCVLPFVPRRLRMLDATKYAAATTAPEEFRTQWRPANSTQLELPPHAYARVEGASS